MADGDLILTLSFQDVTQDPQPPQMGSCGAELYAAMAPLASEDHLHGWALAHVCEALGRMQQAVSDIVRDSDLGPGWSAATDVDLAPGADEEIDLLPFLGQLVGVRGIEPLSDADRRAAIRSRAGFWRGTPGAIASFAERFTDGTPGAVVLRERYDPLRGAAIDAPYHGQVRIKRSRVLPGVDEEELRRLVLERVPAGLIYEVEFSDDRDYDDVAEAFDDYDAVEDGVADYDELLEG